LPPPIFSDIPAENDVPIDIHMEAVEFQAPISPRLGRHCSQNPASLEPTIPALQRFLRHNPQARIVWQHIGWDNTGQMTPALLGRLLAAHENLFMALRVPPRIARPDGRPIRNRLVDPDHNLQADWLRLFQAFPDRFVIGADEFIGPSGRRARIAASFDPTWAMLNQLPKALAEKIGADNARRIYRLQ
jgi:predicted TIM-barrel fold metal-dependent hydrolase